MSTASDIHSPSQLLAVAIEAAAAAARVIEAAARQPSDLVWKQKGESDFVTDVDTDAEAAVVATIRSHYPEATIVGEELSPGTSIGSEGLVFIVDPLDGTTNFLHGFPEYAV